MRFRARFDAVAGGKTRVRFEHSGLPEAFPLDVAKQGFGACFDKLAAMLKASRGDVAAR